MSQKEKRGQLQTHNRTSFFTIYYACCIMFVCTSSMWRIKYQNYSNFADRRRVKHKQRRQCAYERSKKKINSSCETYSVIVLGGCKQDGRLTVWGIATNKRCSEELKIFNLRRFYTNTNETKTAASAGVRGRENTSSVPYYIKY